MAGTGIMVGMGTRTKQICISPSLYPIEKVLDFLYPYPCLVNAGILCKNGMSSDNIHGYRFICHL